jgi:uncharacterized protein YbjT (DUF2867 family)
MQGLVTVFGGTGFVGRQVVRALAKQGLRVRVAARAAGRGYRMRMLGDVGQIEVVQANLRSPESVARALIGAETCINLVGVLYEAGRQRFQSLHAQGSQTVAEEARAAGVTRFIQVSAIGADAHSESRYARTKAEGEAAVRAVYPDAIVVRPSLIFGAEDNFLNQFALMAALSPALPLVGGGETKFQPVWVGDVAAAIARTVTSAEAAGKTYELGGPTVYSFRELMEFVLRETGRKRLLLPIPYAVAGLIGMVGDVQASVRGVLGLIPPPVLTRDQVELLKLDNVASGALPGLAALGVIPSAMEAVAPTYLYRYRNGGQYAELPAGAF